MEFLWRGRWKENEKSALSWEMEHGIRERMHFLTGIPAGNAVLWSLPKVQPRRASLLAWRTRGEENRLGVVQGQYPSIDASFPVTFPRFPFLLFFLGCWIEQDVLGESRPEMIRLKYSLKFSTQFMYLA